MRVAGIVLAGGQSTRMGSPKALLEWHGSTLVRRAVGIVARVVDGPLVVVRAAGQELPPLPDGVELAVDARAARGPLEGIAAGLAQIGDRTDAFFVCGVDAPLLHPVFVRCMIAALADAGEQIDVALPHAHGFDQPLAATYRTTVAGRLAAQLAADRLSVREFVGRCRACRLDADALLADPDIARLDPELQSLANLNDHVDYAAARARPAPAVTIVGRGRARAATVGAAGDGPTTINGRAVSDSEEPLVDGDELVFAMRQHVGPAL